MYQYPYAFEFVRSIRCGWNLGNTFDSVFRAASAENIPSVTDHETAWGNPPTTRGQLEAIRDAGFDAVRIPVTWTQHIGAAPDYRMDPQWLRRVDGIVREAFSLGFRVILNVHHDASPNFGTISPAPAQLERSVQCLCAIWAQIAAHFADLGESLIFETLNEPRCGDDWEGTKETCEAVNQLNAAAVHTIRNAGGCNQTRYLLLPTYAASAKPTALRYMKIPQDDRILISVHVYAPSAFCFPSNEVTWTEPITEWGTQKEHFDHLIRIFDDLEHYCIRKGIPVIIGETGAVFKHNTHSRHFWAAVFTKEAAMRGIPCFWWDEGKTHENGFALLDRHTLTCPDPALISILTGKIYPR
ncbi:MAG: glycoside hydrolase family 5 protein [Oscillospiraceae bacterium]|nr:glycoside hydrolase family 5 protein [Oscillospiraceae bacterium]